MFQKKKSDQVNACLVKVGDEYACALNVKNLKTGLVLPEFLGILSAQAVKSDFLPLMKNRNGSSSLRFVLNPSEYQTMTLDTPSLTGKKKNEALYWDFQQKLTGETIENLEHQFYTMPFHPQKTLVYFLEKSNLIPYIQFCEKSLKKKIECITIPEIALTQYLNAFESPSKKDAELLIQEYDISYLIVLIYQGEFQISQHLPKPDLQHLSDIWKTQLPKVINDLKENHQFNLEKLYWNIEDLIPDDISSLLKQNYPCINLKEKLKNNNLNPEDSRHLLVALGGAC